MYELPNINADNFKKNGAKIINSDLFKIVVLLLIIIIALGFASGDISVDRLKNSINSFLQQSHQTITQLKEVPKAETNYVSKIEYEQAIIDAVKEASPSVVSIVISKNLPVYEQQFIDPFGNIPGFTSPFNFQIPQNVQKGTKYQEVGAGSGFIVSTDGLVLTNKHVVSDKAADYTVVTQDGKKYSAKVLALDPVKDLAIVKISRAQSDRGSSTESGQSSNKFPAIKIGNSDGIQIGQGAIAIGNALGQFSNTVSVGVVSGLGRTVSASGSQGFSETLQGIIQTDAAINPGNSGGPLINLKGEVIGINTAMADGAQSIGFAIPINIAKKDISQVVATNKIVYPFLGVRYVLVDDKVKEKYKLSVDYGAYVLKGNNGEVAVTAGSAAQKAGLQEKDVILEVNGEKITIDNSLEKIIGTYNPQDKVTVKMLRDKKEMSVDVTLGERS